MILTKMKFFIKRPWSSQMTENNTRQMSNYGYLPHYIQVSATPANVLDWCQRWSITPQGHDYWSRITGQNHIRYEEQNQDIPTLSVDI